MDGTVGGFTARDARRIAEAVRRVERSYRNGDPPRRQGPAPPAWVGKLALTPVGGIPARTGSAPSFTPGSATCTLYLDNGTNLVPDPGGATVTVKNSTGSAVAGSKLIQCKIIDGYLYADVEDC